MPLEDHLRLVRSLYEDAIDPVFAVGPAGEVLYANGAARLHAPEGTTIEPSSALGRAILPLMAAGRPGRGEWGEDGPSGVRCWYACSVTPVRDGEGAIAWLCVCTQITDLKRSEERLRRSEQLMVDAQGVAHLGTWEWDVTEPGAHWSAELYRIYGLTPETYTPSYEGYLKMVHPDDRQKVIDATNRVFHEHIPYSHDERIFRPDGTVRYLHTWAYPILDEQGQLRRLMGVCQDITDRAQAEEEVRRMNVDLERRVAARTKELETSMRDLRAFNAMVSHDLRTPLSTIELASALLARPTLSQEGVAKAHARIKRASTQMKTLINDLLAFASIGDAALTRVVIDVSAMAQEIMAELQQASPERVVEVSIEAGMTCLADRTLMRMVMQNLLGNAWKYTARSMPARIEIGTFEASERRVLRVRDNGVGFDMKDAHRLFVPFERLHPESEFKGTGFGLASVHRILERHGSRVWAEGAIGNGATFFVELPDEAAAVVAAAGPRGAVPGTPGPS